MGHFRDKVSIVTGGTSGIGRALGEELAHRGAVVMLADRNTQLLSEVGDSIAENGGNVETTSLDVSDSRTLSRAHFSF